MSTLTEPSATQADRLFERARQGDDAAWNELFQVCYPKIVRAVRRRLHKPMRSLYDSTDFASDVMKSLAANADRLQFATPAALFAFLERVAEQKVIDSYRKSYTQRRDLDRESPLANHDGGDRPLGLASADPTPSQVALGHEAHDLLLADASDQEREVIALKCDGYTLPEISERTGWHLRGLQRYFKDLRTSFGKAREES